MFYSVFFAAVHYLALPLGLGGLFMRGRYLRAVSQGIDRNGATSRLFIADNCWGIAALLWLATGLARAFAGFEKGSAFYLHSPLFWVKMGLFGIVGSLEVLPMITFIRWRIARRNQDTINYDIQWVHKLRLINDFQISMSVMIPFVASAMARGVGLSSSLF